MIPKDSQSNEYVFKTADYTLPVNKKELGVLF